jgi:hypothetical protein
MLHIDDIERLDAYATLLGSESAPRVEGMSERERRLARMLVASIADTVLAKGVSLQQALDLVWRHPQVRAELAELFALLAGRVTHVHVPLDAMPLQIHARYTRIEILASFGIGSGAKVAAWQTGVYWAPEALVDLLAFTLDKTSGSFSPTTRYRDYAISPTLIHWESQSTTREDGETGRRYREHASRGTSVMLFARLTTDDRAFWFLGPGRYVSHDGERPMGIKWKLEHALPGDLFARFAAAVA